eukprot:SAG11_NODE_920_length_6544_cov_10.456323_2_plen_582_part_00
MVALLAANASSTACIACTLILTLLEERALLDGDGTRLSPLLGAREGALPSPDELCKDLKLCDGYPSCHLFPAGAWPPRPSAPGGTPEEPSELARILSAGGLERLRREVTAASVHVLPGLLQAPVQRFAQESDAALAFPDPCGTNLTCLIFRIGTLHQPLLDMDGDVFAPAEGGENGLFSRRARGSHWRGADCNDANGEIYPGRRATADELQDTNCNGIHGVDKATGVAYEKQWCQGENEPRGVIVLGDSASAHFHIPPDWFSAANFSLEQLLTQAPVAADELDYPQCSWSTGHAENASVAAAQCPQVWRQHGEAPSPLPLDSFYARLRGRNRCNHRDFQNIGVNGARAAAVAPPDGIVNGMARSQSNDVPAIVFHALIGNDVCNGHPGMGHMTTAEAFGKSVNATLDHLEATLPPNSTVILVAVAQGTLLYDVTQTLIHPLGTPYPAFYEYMSCLGVNPCWGWLNSNATWRNATQARADELNAMYGRLVAQRRGSFQNFELLYYNPDLRALIAEYVEADPATRQPIDCIEPCDGFHPSQPLQMLYAGSIWDWLQKLHPHVLGAVNPHNAAIEARFGDQGGY